MNPLEWHDDELHLRLYVQPKASRDAFGERHGDEVRLRITAPPVDGKANSHLQKLLAKAFGVPKSSVTLRRGETSRHKYFIISRPRKIPGELQPHLDQNDSEQLLSK